MSEEKVQETVQENLDIKVENKPENAASGLLQEVMAKKATIKERDARIAELEAAEEKRRQKQLTDAELLAEYKVGKEKDQAEIARLSKYEDDEKADLITSIASGEEEEEQLSKESLSTLRLLKNKITREPRQEIPSMRGAVGTNVSSKPWGDMTEEERRVHYTQKANEQSKYK